MTIGMKKDEVIKLLKLSWDWSGRFSRRQYATVSVIVFLLWRHDSLGFYKYASINSFHTRFYP
jgi:hypothetical protein